MNENMPRAVPHSLFRFSNLPVLAPYVGHLTVLCAKRIDRPPLELLARKHAKRVVLVPWRQPLDFTKDHVDEMG